MHGSDCVKERLLHHGNVTKRQLTILQMPIQNSTAEDAVNHRANILLRRMLE